VCCRARWRGVLRGSNAYFLWAAAWTKENRRGESAHCLSRLDRRARETVVRGMQRNLGWMAAEFARFPKYSKEKSSKWSCWMAHENFPGGAAARERRALSDGAHRRVGVVLLCACALRISLHYMARRIDNQRIDALVNSYRCLPGNRPISKTNRPA